MRPAAAVDARDHRVGLEHDADRILRACAWWPARSAAASSSPPTAGATRPTTDRVREAVFNALTSLDIIVDARVVDLYAGSGAIGIEALSRGATHCTFVERDRGALSAIHANVGALGLTGRHPRRGGRRRRVRRRGSTPTSPSSTRRTTSTPGTRLLTSRRPPPFVVAESGRRGAGAVPAGSRRRVKRYGRTWVTFLARTG